MLRTSPDDCLETCSRYLLFSQLATGGRDAGDASGYPIGHTTCHRPCPRVPCPRRHFLATARLFVGSSTAPLATLVAGTTATTCRRDRGDVTRGRLRRPTSSWEG